MYWLALSAVSTHEMKKKIFSQVCGHMKKIFLIFAAVLSIILSSCAPDSTDDKSANTRSPTPNNDKITEPVVVTPTSSPDEEEIYLEIKQKINVDMPEWTFVLTGTRETDTNGYSYNNINKIAIYNDKYELKQELHCGTHHNVPEAELYGFQLIDYNFDGYLDISLFSFAGGSMQNNPTRFWLFEDEPMSYHGNRFLDNLSRYSTVSVCENEEGAFLTAYARAGYENYTSYYQFKRDQYYFYKLVTCTLEFIDNKLIYHYTVEKEIDNIMTIVDTYSVETDYPSS